VLTARARCTAWRLSRSGQQDWLFWLALRSCIGWRAAC